ncbi:methyl-accepting chemotaxis protein [Haloarcula salinisoli]|uniref:Methyl-accepting chemotaxis protein n=1 Tax=Haloarcula salinisoli TaxID=2487746 RepID=A0A8J8C8Y4_9EURY|nr:methyl-accepting chemotaxis protein [Halomicroarcula salinisoli]MBX0303644.1 methyl-accepting chemotaxis protein [Halomicroarcula salinisoli]
MSNGRDTNSNVVTRGLGALRDAFTGGSDDAEQTQTDEDTARTGGDEPTAPSKRTAEEYADTMQQCADGDLTVRMEGRGEDEAMDRMADEFNEMVSELEKTTDHLKSYVGEVEGAGVGVEESSDTVRRASDNVIDSMQTISGDIGAQREQLQAASETIDGVVAALEEVAASHPDADIEPQIARLEEQASEIRDAANIGEGVQTETQVVGATVAEQSAELNDVSRRANDLQRYATPLSAILDRFKTNSENESSLSNESAAVEE